MTPSRESDSETPITVEIEIGIDRLVNMLEAECDAAEYQIREVIDALDSLGLIVRSAS